MLHQSIPSHKLTRRGPVKRHIPCGSFGSAHPRFKQQITNSCLANILIFSHANLRGLFDGLPAHGHQWSLNFAQSNHLLNPLAPTPSKQLNFKYHESKNVSKTCRCLNSQFHYLTWACAGRWPGTRLQGQIRPSPRQLPDRPQRLPGPTQVCLRPRLPRLGRQRLSRPKQSIDRTSRRLYHR